jgi:hypothetical protein
VNVAYIREDKQLNYKLFSLGFSDDDEDGKEFERDWGELMKRRKEEEATRIARAKQARGLAQTGEVKAGTSPDGVTSLTPVSKDRAQIDNKN